MRKITAKQIKAYGGLESWMQEQSATTKKSTHSMICGENCESLTIDTRRSKNRAQNRKNNTPSEHVEQVAFVRWARAWLPADMSNLLFAIPNGGQRNVLVAKKLKAEGVVSGVPDLFFAHSRLGFHGLFIEMKRKKGGSLSKSQRDMIDTLQDSGYACAVCKGADEAIEAMRAYMLDSDDRFFK